MAKWNHGNSIIFYVQSINCINKPAVHLKRSASNSTILTKVLLVTSSKKISRIFPVRFGVGFTLDVVCLQFPHLIALAQKTQPGETIEKL